MAASADLNKIWDDLVNWQEEIKKKDESLAKKKLVHDLVLPPVQEPAEILLDEAKPVGLQKLYSRAKSAPSKAKSVSGKKSRAEEAEAEKAKGNEYFVKKDYKNAILHYGKAIDMDPTKPVYFVNRAMAFLKVNSFLEAERDCTRGIQLQPDNVKAYWRRGIALKELGRMDEARKDFESALKVEPNNKAVLEELSKLPKLKQQDTKTKKAPEVKPAAKQQNDSALAETKRRLPIHVVDEEYIDSSKIQKVESSTKSLPIKQEKLVTDKVSEKPTARTEQKQQSKAPQPPIAKVKAKEPQNEIKTSTKTASPASKPAAAVPLTFKCPQTNFEFERDWKTYKARGDDALYQYLQIIPPSLYADIFKSSLESDQFEKMIELLEERYTKEKTPEDIFDVLKGLSKVKRIDMLVMFLGKKHQQALRSLFSVLKESQALNTDEITNLSKIYSRS